MTVGSLTLRSAETRPSSVARPGLDRPLRYEREDVPGSVTPGARPSETLLLQVHQIQTARPPTDYHSSVSLEVVQIELRPTTRAHLEKQVDDLHEEFHGVVSREAVARVVEESLVSISEARFDDYIPLLAYRFSRERLGALGQAEGKIVKTTPEVLFVCVENAGRSQMAAGLLDAAAEGRVHVRSAGSNPAERINANVVEAMEELGIDVSAEFPKPMTDEVVRAADVVITMGCGDACPVYPGKTYRDWEVEDPAGKSLDDVRRIRDEIGGRVDALLAELDAHQP